MKHSTTSYLHRMENDRCLLTFELLSDLHITYSKNLSSFDHALEDIWKRKTKVVALLGDLSSHGLSFQLKQCFSKLKEFPFRYLIALGNHDIYPITSKKQLHIHPLYKELALKTHTDIYYDVYVEGFHFYILNSEHNPAFQPFYSSKQCSWLKEQLANDDPNKPVFVLCHYPIKNTHLHSDEKDMSMGVQTHELTSILKMHPHVIFISGHLHNSYEQCRVQVDNTLFEIDVPSFHHTMYGQRKEEIGFQIQVYHDFLCLRTRDYQQQAWITSHAYILDFKTNHCYPLDEDSLPTPQ